MYQVIVGLFKFLNVFDTNTHVFEDNMQVENINNNFAYSIAAAKLSEEQNSFVLQQIEALKAQLPNKEVNQIDDIVFVGSSSDFDLVKDAIRGKGRVFDFIPIFDSFTLRVIHFGLQVIKTAGHS